MGKGHEEKKSGVLVFRVGRRGEMEGTWVREPGDDRVMMLMGVICYVKEVD